MFPSVYGQENTVFRKRPCVNRDGKTIKDGMDQWVKDLTGEFIKCSHYKKEMVIIGHDGGVS